MGHAHYFALSTLLIFIFQGIYFCFKKTMYQFSSPLKPVCLAVFGAFCFSLLEALIKKLCF